MIYKTEFYSTVYKVKHVLTNKLYSMKVIPKRKVLERTEKDGNIEGLQLQKDIIRGDHPFVEKVLKVF